MGWDNHDAQVICRQQYGDNFGQLNLLLIFTRPNSYHIIILCYFIVGEVYPSFHLFPSSSYLAQEFMCNGTENFLSQCGYNRSISPECFAGNRSAAVVCRQGKSLCRYSITETHLYLIPVCHEGDVRLVNRSYSPLYDTNHLGGVVQVCVNGQFGYVCADDWDDREAEVVCRSLSKGHFYTAPYYGIHAH